MGRTKIQIIEDLFNELKTTGDVNIKIKNCIDENLVLAVNKDKKGEISIEIRAYDDRSNHTNPNTLYESISPKNGLTIVYNQDNDEDYKEVQI